MCGRHSVMNGNCSVMWGGMGLAPHRPRAPPHPTCRRRGSTCGGRTSNPHKIRFSHEYHSYLHAGGGAGRAAGGRACAGHQGGAAAPASRHGGILRARALGDTAGRSREGVRGRALAKDAQRRSQTRTDVRRLHRRSREGCGVARHQRRQQTFTDAHRRSQTRSVSAVDTTILLLPSAPPETAPYCFSAADAKRNPKLHRQAVISQVSSSVR